MESNNRPHILFYAEAEGYVSGLKPFPFEKMGTVAWWMQQRYVEQLTMQAVSHATVNEDEFVKELLLTYDKIPVLIHELIAIEIWRQKIFRVILEVHEEEMEDNGEPPTLALAMGLHYEATIVTLLETIFFHGDCCEAAKDVVIDVADYCYRRLLHLINEHQNKTVELENDSTVESLMAKSAVEDLNRQEADIQFQIGLKCLSILRYFADNFDKLPLALLTRFLDEYDIPLLLTNLMEDAPWVQKKKNKDGKIELKKHENGQWRSVDPEDVNKIGKIEAQVWMLLLRLLVGVEYKYEITTARRNRLIKLRPLLTEVVMDQIPALTMLCQFLDMTSFSDGGPVKRDFLIEQIPEVWTQLMEQGRKRGWRKIATHLASNFLDCEYIKQEAKNWATTYDPDTWEQLLPDAPKCVNCGKAGSKRCSKCKNEWYCGRKCQVTHWPKHKKACDLMSTSDETVRERIETK